MKHMLIHDTPHLAGLEMGKIISSSTKLLSIRKSQNCTKKK